jgi:hypothetical protein
MPPPEVQEAAAKVQAWLDGKAGAATPPAPKQLSAAEKLDRARTFDQSKMPAWKDPRT